MQHKLLAINETQVKFSKNGAATFSGYASVFGGIDSYGDTIVPGAYKGTLENRTRAIKMRWNHYGPVIGKWTSIVEDGKGLYVEGELTPGHRVATDVAASLKHGAVDGMSIGYYVPEGGSEYSPVTDVRLLKQIELVEISVVEEPADNAARVSDVKSALDAAQSLKEIEALLRDAAGFSRADAVALVARVKALSSRGDRVDTPDEDQLEALFNLIRKRV